MNDKILNEIDSIISFIKESEDYKDYLFLKDKLSKNEKALSLINEIKKTQKELVKKELRKEDIKELDDKINNYLKELNRIPLYVDFITCQQKLNNYIDIFRESLNKYFLRKLN